MAKRRRYGTVGSHWNSKKYLAMHNANISAGLRRYHANKRQIKSEDPTVPYILVALFFTFLIARAVYIMVWL